MKKKEETYTDIKNKNEHSVLYAVLFVVVFMAFIFNYKALLERVCANTEGKEQHNLTSLLDDKFTDYSLLDAHCNKSTIGNIDFSAFYISSDDTLYKCKYDSSSDKLYMQEVSDSPIVLSGKESSKDY